MYLDAQRRVVSQQLNEHRESVLLHHELLADRVARVGDTWKTPHRHDAFSILEMAVCLTDRAPYTRRLVTSAPSACGCWAPALLETGLPTHPEAVVQARADGIRDLRDQREHSSSESEGVCAREETGCSLGQRWAHEPQAKRRQGQSHPGKATLTDTACGSC